MKQKKIGDYLFWEQLKGYLNRRVRDGNLFHNPCLQGRISNLSVEQLLTSDRGALREIARYAISRNIQFEKLLATDLILGVLGGPKKPHIPPGHVYLKFDKYEIEIRMIDYTNYLTNTHKWGYALLYSKVDNPTSVMVEGPLNEQELHFSVQRLLKNIKDLF